MYMYMYTFYSRFDTMVILRYVHVHVHVVQICLNTKKITQKVSHATTYMYMYMYDNTTYPVYIDVVLKM